MKILRVCLSAAVVAGSSWAIPIASSNVHASRGDVMVSLFWLGMIPAFAGVAAFALWLIWDRPSYQDINSWLSS